MAEEDDFFRQALGAGGSDIFRAEDIEDVGAEDPEGAGDAAETEDERGQDEVPADVQDPRAEGEEVVV